jgi:hypothetical protein
MSGWLEKRVEEKNVWAHLGDDGVANLIMELPRCPNITGLVSGLGLAQAAGPPLGVPAFRHIVIPIFMVGRLY